MDEPTEIHRVGAFYVTEDRSRLEGVLSREVELKVWEDDFDRHIYSVRVALPMRSRTEPQFSSSMTRVDEPDCVEAFAFAVRRAAEIMREFERKES